MSYASMNSVGGYKTELRIGLDSIYKVCTQIKKKHQHIRKSITKSTSKAWFINAKSNT